MSSHLNLPNKPHETVPSIDISKELSKYFNDSQICHEGRPNFVLLTGGVGNGKTTLRRKQYAKGYVHIDAAEIFASFAKGKYYDFPVAFEESLNLIGSLIARRAIKEKRNIVMEIIGDSFEDASAIIAAMKSAGYEVKISFVECDQPEAYRRHLNAVKTDVNYVSAFHTQRFHKKWVLEAVLRNGPDGNTKDETNQERINSILKKFGFKENELGGMEGTLRGLSFTICINPLKGLCFMGNGRGERAISTFEEYMRLSDVTEKSLSLKILQICDNYGDPK